MTKNNKINYIEIPVQNIEKTKSFFQELFGWEFTDYGPDYVAFNNAGIDGGFYLSENNGFASQSAPLVVLYSNELKNMVVKVEAAGGTICQEIFSFPGGYRFHFKDINNNEYAIWSESAE